MRKLFFADRRMSLQDIMIKMIKRDLAWTSVPGRAILLKRSLLRSDGFTLLEVLVTLTVLAIGAALTLSLISGSMGNIRKAQLKTRAVEHAEEVMELALLKAIQAPTDFSDDFEDGCRWLVHVEEYEPPGRRELDPRDLRQNMPVKLLRYTVEVFYPDSTDPDYRLQTLKLVSVPKEDRSLELMQ